MIFYFASLNDVYIASEVQKRVMSQNITTFSNSLSFDQDLVLEALRSRGVKSFAETKSMSQLAKEYNFEEHEFLEEILIK